MLFINRPMILCALIYCLIMPRINILTTYLIMCCLSNDYRRSEARWWLWIDWMVKGWWEKRERGREGEGRKEEEVGRGRRDGEGEKIGM